MKKAVVAVMAVMMLIGALAKADEKKSQFEIRNIEGQKLVMITMDMTKAIDQITKGNLTDDEKLAQVRAMTVELGSLTSSDDSFCKVSGDTYQTVNTNAQKMAEQCERRMHGEDMVHELVTDYKDLAELQYLYSVTYMMQITFSM